MRETLSHEGGELMTRTDGMVCVRDGTEANRSRESSSPMHPTALRTSPLNRAVLAAGLGFFVDAFDLLPVQRVPYPQSDGTGAQRCRAAPKQGERLLALQMAGMMVGGILTGIVGDRRGRVAVLFGSIVLYSLCNLANAVVQDVDTYAAIRFLAGLGLAGELGAGVTLVAESMTAGTAGATAPSWSPLWVPWERYARGSQEICCLGGRPLRWPVALVCCCCCSGFEAWRRACSNGPRQVLLVGAVWHLFADRRRALRTFACIAMGVPIWFSVGLLITPSPELAAQQGVDGWVLTRGIHPFPIGHYSW